MQDQVQENLTCNVSVTKAVIDITKNPDLGWSFRVLQNVVKWRRGIVFPHHTVIGHGLP